MCKVLLVDNSSALLAIIYYTNNVIKALVAGSNDSHLYFVHERIKYQIIRNSWVSDSLL